MYLLLLVYFYHYIEYFIEYLDFYKWQRIFLDKFIFYLLYKILTNIVVLIDNHLCFYQQPCVCISNARVGICESNSETASKSEGGATSRGATPSASVSQAQVKNRD